MYDPFVFENKFSQQMTAGKIKQTKEANSLGGNYHVTYTVMNQVPDENYNGTHDLHIHNCIHV